MTGERFHTKIMEKLVVLTAKTGKLHNKISSLLHRIDNNKSYTIIRQEKQTQVNEPIRDQPIRDQPIRDQPIRTVSKLQTTTTKRTSLCLYTRSVVGNENKGNT